MYSFYFYRDAIFYRANFKKFWRKDLQAQSFSATHPRRGGSGYVGAGGTVAPPDFVFAPPVWHVRKIIVTKNNISSRLIRPILCCRG